MDFEKKVIREAPTGSLLAFLRLSVVYPNELIDGMVERELDLRIINELGG